jgi:hypothetical protein
METEPEVEYYLIKVNYKSGHSEYFKVTDFEFEIKTTGRTAKWTAYEPAGARPILINLDDIESVWQVEAKLKEAF